MAQDRVTISGRRGPSLEAVAQARRLFETTALAVAAIARETGIKRSTLADRARREGWRRPEPVGAEQAERRGLRIDGLRAKIETEIRRMERTLSDSGVGGAERMARTLASLVRTLRELTRYDIERQAAAEVQDDVVGDVDGLRRALAERLDRLRRERGG
jgi:hypothetical protein